MVIERSHDMKYGLLLLLSPLLSSCFFLSDFKRTPFQYADGTQVHTRTFVVPRGYKAQKTVTDSAGTTVQTFTYGNSLFYIAYLRDTTIQIQPISPKENMPEFSLVSDAVVYKGMDSSDLFWREVRQHRFRVGYRFVPPLWEDKFDSATNYAIVTRLTQ